MGPLVAMLLVARKAGTHAGTKAAALWERTATAAAERSVARVMHPQDQVRDSAWTCGGNSDPLVK